ncbi:hypothetical protein KUTeg_005794 [Tegillarca granosa]|uniref:Tetratricopeptide repeat protein 1 n=1 Tax=Tegillarca granosa TaxID=220873 RepID=A0ABQ9FJ21_TEGGR|nr:hypothetical protein KUTeg_005794 [Tegillarca granosa]
MSNKYTSQTSEDVASSIESFGIQETGSQEEPQNQPKSSISEPIPDASEKTKNVSVVTENLGHTEPISSKIEQKWNSSFSGVMESNPSVCAESGDSGSDKCDVKESDCSKLIDNPVSNCDKSLTDENNDENSGQSFSSSESDDDDEYLSAEEEGDIVIDEQSLLELEKNLTEEEKAERKNQAQSHKEEGNKLFKEQNYKEAIKCYGKALRLCPVAFPKDRAIMYSNRAACWMKLAVLRRAQLYEKGDKLDEALSDYQRVLELDPSERTARAACMKLPDLIKERNEKMKEEMMSKLKDIGNMILRPFGLSTNNFQMQQNPETGGYSVQFQQNPGNGK